MAFCDSIKLEKGMYSISGKGFTQVLESIDPSENYKGSALEGLDAYQRQLKRFNIKVSGAGCDTVEKFFRSTDSAVLFPEFISRAIKQGIAACKILPEITAATTVINGTDYRSITSTTATAADTDGTEGNSLRVVNVRNANSLVTLKKYGRLFNSSYEALRFQNLDVVAVIFKQIGMDIANDRLKDAVTTLSASAGTTNSATANTLVYDDILELWSDFGSYSPNVMIAANATIKDMLSLTPMQDADAGLDFHGTGKLISPLGAKLIANSNAGTSKILAFDKNFALQMIQSGDITVEYDKMIDKQLETAAISTTAGFSKLFGDSVRVLDYTTART